MTRLTLRSDAGKAAYKPLDPDCGRCTSCDRRDHHMSLLTDRLADYEDLGTLTHICKLVQAEKGGRVLPRKCYFTVTESSICVVISKKCASDSSKKSNAEIIDGLKDLVKDRESFIEGDADHDEVFLYDIEVLKSAIQQLEAQQK